MTTPATEEPEQPEMGGALAPERQQKAVAGNAAAIQLLDEWMAEGSGYDERVWPIVERALSENPV